MLIGKAEVEGANKLSALSVPNNIPIATASAR